MNGFDIEMQGCDVEPWDQECAGFVGHLSL